MTERETWRQIERERERESPCELVYVREVNSTLISHGSAACVFHQDFPVSEQEGMLLIKMFILT